MTRREKQSTGTPRRDEGDARRPDRARAAPSRDPRQLRPYPDPVDNTLDDSFPASDPPSWAGS
jgi:hypothetical protein